jgi:hypothetical protein
MRAYLLTEDEIKHINHLRALNQGHRQVVEITTEELARYAIEPATVENVIQFHPLLG